MRADVRLRALSVLEPTLDQSALYQDHLSERISYHAGVRLSERTWNLNALEYLGEASLQLWGPFSASLRLHHQFMIPETIGSTVLLAGLHIRYRFLPFLGLQASGGWYERFTTLAGSPLLTFTASPYDHDFAGAFGFDVYPYGDLHVELKASTFDTFEVFRLNNFFFWASADFPLLPEGPELQVYGRYKVLLGFGRMDEFLMGAGLRFKI